MSTQKRQLAGIRVGLSISDGEDSSALGFPTSEVNRTILRFVAALLGQGTKLGFGHDWRDDGVMESVYAFAERFSLTARDPHDEPPLWNLVAWPDKPYLPEADRERLKRTLRIETLGLPRSLRDFAADRKDPQLFRYLRARGLTHLRHQLTQLCSIRVCVGGRTTTFAGRYPGIVEEAYFAAQAKQPLFLAGLLGGAAKKLISILKVEADLTAFSANGDLEELYKKPPVQEAHPDHPDDLQCSMSAVLNSFSQLGMEGLSRLNKLSVDENHRLFETQVVEEAIDLILTGMGRLESTRK